MNTKLHRYVDEVMRFRKALNLTSVSDPDEFWQRFILPSLDLLPLMPTCGRLMDIGSGMGVPGIPLMIARPELYGILVERRKKRTEFLRHVIRTLKLNGEAVADDVRNLEDVKIDIFTARAVAHPHELLSMCTAHATPDAIAVLPVAQTFDGQHIDDWTILADSFTHAVQPQRLVCFKKGGMFNPQRDYPRRVLAAAHQQGGVEKATKQCKRLSENRKPS